VARSKAEVVTKAFLDHGITLTEEELKQDEDVLDTWFSSWLWPISVFDGFKDPDNKDILYYYPTADLVTAPEILFFWVARMIMAGYEFRGEAPFRNVYLTGIVRDQQGRKMSKQLGNSPDPLDLIASHGADAVRFGMLKSSPAGNDLLYDEKLIEQGRNFTNKLWNALRLVQGWEVADHETPENEIAATWFESALNQALKNINEHFTKFRISDALMTTYKLIWDDFCSAYLEMIKPPYQQPIDQKTKEQAISCFEVLLKLLHPFMPFITEELWHALRERKPKECLIVAPWPQSGHADKEQLAQMEKVLEAVAGLRALRNSKGLSPNKALPMTIRTAQPELYEPYQPILAKLVNASEIRFADSFPETASTVLIGSDEFGLDLEGMVDTAAEKERISKELEYVRGFLNSVEKKLQNERFVSGAPETVLQNERNKKADAESKIQALEKSLASLG
jgi:valyl-tRNA synthetase